MIGSEKYRSFLQHPGMNGGGGSGGGTSKTTSEVPKELKPLAERYSKAGITNFDTPFNPYNDQRYADLTAPQLTGLNMVQNRAMNGSPLIDSATSNLGQLMSGGKNPYLDQMFNQAADQMQNRVNSNAALSGRLGSNAHGEAFSKGLAQAATSIYGQAYESDQNRRLAAIGQAQPLANQGYQDASQMLNAGQILQDQAQNPLDFSFQQYQDAKNKPYQDMAAAAGIFQSQPFGQSSTTKQSGGGK